MPEATLNAVADHGIIPAHDNISDTVEQSRAVFDALTDVGINLPEVFTTLEAEGVEKFVAAWTTLTEAIATQLTPKHHAQ